MQRAFHEHCAVKLDRTSTQLTLVSQMLMSAVAVPLWEQQLVTGGTHRHARGARYARSDYAERLVSFFTEKLKG